MVEIAEQVEVRTPEAPVELDELGQVLLKARDIIRTNGWCQNAYMDYDNPDDWVEMKKSPKVCLLGAINVACGGMPDQDEVRTEADVWILNIEERMGIPHDLTLPNWNDATDRTQQEVEERLERAAYNV